MIVSAYTVLLTWIAAVAGEAEFTSATWANKITDPSALTDDQLPYLFVFNEESTVALLDWQQRETTLEFDCWIVERTTGQGIIDLIEVIEDLAVTDPTLSNKVRTWHVASWAIYELPDTDETGDETDPIRLALVHVSTERIEG